MFTGIVEETGRVVSIRPGKTAIELAVQARVCGRGLKTGDSLAVNGCCLTVEHISPRGKDKLLLFSLLQESWRRTNLQFATAGAGVNLERALRVGGRLGGHFVSGHIDGLGRIRRWEQSGQDYILEIAAPADIMRCVVFKGSIAVDGISLTVAAVRRGSFDIWIIPHTREKTALAERKKGGAVNLETDLLGKFVEKFIAARAVYSPP
ncbi:MAG TPA: riboflavin synthase [Verrucomicrobiae bacterium]|jgi:riboflavin synthase